MSRHPRGQARIGRRPAEDAPPCALFEPSPMPCRDCGETTGHAPRCPRNPDAEIVPEPVYARGARTDAPTPQPAEEPEVPGLEVAVTEAVAVTEEPPPQPIASEIVAPETTPVAVAEALTELDLGAAVFAAQQPTGSVDAEGAAHPRSDEAPWLEAEEALLAEMTRRLMELFDRTAREATSAALAELSRRRGAP